MSLANERKYKTGDLFIFTNFVNCSTVLQIIKITKNHYIVRNIILQKNSFLLFNWLENENIFHKINNNIYKHQQYLFRPVKKLIDVDLFKKDIIQFLKED